MNILKQFLVLVSRQLTKIEREYTLRNIINRYQYKTSLHGLKDIHKGKRCFIIGNGPSLTPEDLTLLKNEYSFAANRIFYIFNKTPWRPSYYCGQDIVVIEDIADKLDTVIGCCEKTFISSRCWSLVPKNVKNNQKVSFFFPRFRAAHKEELFSGSIDKYVSDGGTVTYAAIQIAVYMGFKEIYLLGCDHSYSTTSFNNQSLCNEDIKGSYFEGMPENIKMTAPRTDNATISYIKAKEYCDEHGIKIYNATRGGKLEVFDRINLDDIV